MKKSVLKTVKSKILKMEKVAWRDLEWFQPEGFKDEDAGRSAKLENSIIRSGILDPFKIWQRGGKVFILDGHIRQRHLKAMEAAGVSIPKKLDGVFLDIKTVAEAKRAVFIFNSHYAQVNKNAALDWTEGDNLADMEDQISVFGLDLSDSAGESLTPVKFDAKKTFQIVVTCKTRKDRAALVQRLTGDGYECKVK